MASSSAIGSPSSHERISNTSIFFHMVLRSTSPWYSRLCKFGSSSFIGRSPKMWNLTFKSCCIFPANLQNISGSFSNDNRPTKTMLTPVLNFLLWLWDLLIAIKFSSNCAFLIECFICLETAKFIDKGESSLSNVL